MENLSHLPTPWRSLLQLCVLHREEAAAKKRVYCTPTNSDCEAGSFARTSGRLFSLYILICCDTERFCHYSAGRIRGKAIR